MLGEQNTIAYIGFSWLDQEDRETRIPSVAPDLCRFVLFWLHLQPDSRFFPRAGEEQGGDSVVHIKSAQ